MQYDNHDMSLVIVIFADHFQPLAGSTNSLLHGNTTVGHKKRRVELYSVSGGDGGGAAVVSYYTKL